jgi:hypothetical protein
MSVSQRYNRTAVPLPPEIWIHIFDIATHVPGILNVDDIDSEMHPQSAQHQRRLLKQSLVTKRYLVRVCWKWNHLASRFLYHSILITRGRMLSSLYSTLANSIQGSQETDKGIQSLGWWTKRLDIALRDPGRYTPFEELDYLAKAIRCLPMLTIVTFSPRPHSGLQSSDIIDALCTCGSNLQGLASYNLQPSRNKLRRLLTVSPNMRALHCQQREFYESGDSRYIEPPMMPALTSLGLTAESCDECSTPNCFPSLREVVYHFSGTEPSWRSFLRVHSGNLTKITICLNSIYYVFQQVDSDVISEFCPNLENLSLSLYSWRQLPDGIILPSVPNLWLRFGTFKASTKQYKSIFRTLCSIVPPSLRVIRLTDPRNVHDLRVRHARALQVGIMQLSSKGCLLEDYEGKYMSF